jgi:HEAT repeat protein
VKDSRFQEETLLPVAKKMLGDRSEPVRYRAVAVLGGIKKEEMCSIIVEALNDPSPAVRGQALRELSRGGRKDLSGQYLKGLSDSSPFVRACAIAALTGLGDREYASTIMSLIDDRESTFYFTWYMDGDYYRFNGPQRTVQYTVVWSIERLFNRRFSGKVDDCRLWWAHRVGN